MDSSFVVLRRTDQAASAHQEVLRNERERGQDADLDSTHFDAAVEVYAVEILVEVVALELGGDVQIEPVDLS